MRIGILVAGLVACLFSATHALATEPTKSLLARLAADLKPGEWAELKTEGYTDDLLRDTRDGVKPVHWIYQYTNRISWNRPTQELYFMGAGHASRRRRSRCCLPLRITASAPRTA